MINPILNQIGFNEKLEKFIKDTPKYTSIKFKHSYFLGNTGENDNNQRIIVKDLVISKTELEEIKFEHIHFKNCTFKDIRISELNAYDCIFENCIFENVSLSNSVFFMCEFNDCIARYSHWVFIQFSDTSINNFSFNFCFEILEMYFGGCSIENLKFTNSYVAHCRFPPIAYISDTSNFIFDICRISSCIFLNLDLSKTFFSNCSFEQSSFNNCIISKGTFGENNATIDEAFCSIDLRTLKESEVIKEQDLLNLFGIHHHDIKSYVSELTEPINFQSIFISYSFKDKSIASKINEFLRVRGIFTFLWEKDAPGGKPLKKIMSDGIRKFDRVLFIASENSIKSKACQYELTHGRKKQELLWKTILFPIHIDDYLFEINKDDIRPKSIAEEYWLNIEELRNINSIDFSEFTNETIDVQEFSTKINLLVKDLRK